MKNWITIPASFVLLCICFSIDAFTQNRKINYTFEVDGKRVHEKLRVSFVVGNKQYKARSTRNAFWLPPEAIEAETITIRFHSRKYAMEFNIYAKDMISDWIIGVDNRPFETDRFDTKESPYADACLLQYVVFSRGGSILINSLLVGNPGCDSDAKSTIR